MSAWNSDSPKECPLRGERRCGVFFVCVRGWGIIPWRMDTWLRSMVIVVVPYGLHSQTWNSCLRRRSQDVFPLVIKNSNLKIPAVRKVQKNRTNWAKSVGFRVLVAVWWLICCSSTSWKKVPEIRISLRLPLKKTAVFKESIAVLHAWFSKLLHPKNPSPPPMETPHPPDDTQKGASKQLATWHQKRHPKDS